MTTNHPAHGPVSLDRLHQISGILSKAAAQSDGGNLGYAMADAVKVIDGAISAFGAEPVAWLLSGGGAKNHVSFDSSNAYADPLREVTPLYAAPQLPQPAVEALKRLRSIVADHKLLPRRKELVSGQKYSYVLLESVEAMVNDACRAAMLQGGNSPVTPDCWCRICRPVTMSDMRFVVCPECGNKRCPHANDHNNACTGSNEPGQVGSAYPAAPQQEVKSALEHGMQRYAGAMQKLSEGDK
jgi:hypothetical protein